VALGGPGAVFVVLAYRCVGIATKYSEGLLAIKTELRHPMEQ
jgi:Na+/alanine symporter